MYIRSGFSGHFFEVISWSIQLSTHILACLARWIYNCVYK